MLSASVDMLEHLGHMTHANILRSAIDTTVNVDKIHTAGMLVDSIIRHRLLA